MHKIKKHFVLEVLFFNEKPYGFYRHSPENKIKDHCLSSYRVISILKSKWAHKGSNLGQTDYESATLTD